MLFNVLCLGEDMYFTVSYAHCFLFDPVKYGIIFKLNLAQ